MAVSLTATRDIIEYLSDRFSSSGQKNIVIVSSVASDLVACEQGPEYHVAKAGLVQMTRYYAVSLGRRGIRVNCICPAIVMKDEAKPYYEKHKAAVRLFESITPLGRMGTPEDIANAIYINSYFPHQLKEIVKKINAKLVHISTDCVFSGKKGNYIEIDEKEYCVDLG